ncbi:MAG: hypothetical protein WA709_31875 [Stellaceae bacterium]
MRFGASLIDQPADILIGQPGHNRARARFPPAGDQLVGLDRDRNAIIRIEAPSLQLGGTSLTVVSITSL